MNIYFLVEGQRTEMIVYPKWLQILVPELLRVQQPHQVYHNNYYIFSGQGYPALLHSHLKDCIGDANDVGRFDYFVICLDADEKTVAETENEVLHFMQKHKIRLRRTTQLVIIVQQKCIESWFLGNPKTFTDTPQLPALKQYVAFYNVAESDPEAMTKPDFYKASASLFHVDYFEKMIREASHNRLHYSKRNPYAVCQPVFLQELVKRSRRRNKHLASFKRFHQFCLMLRRNITH